MLRICSLLVLVLLAGCTLDDPAPEAQAGLVGRAVVVDGDTLDLAGQRVRLFGIDAPEMRQGCTDATGKAWACGRWAAQRLAELVAEGAVTCTPRDRDRYGRIVASCGTAAGDLGAAMVAGGAATAYLRYSRLYAGLEAIARRNGWGIWQGGVVAPEEWRRAQG